MKKLRKNVCVLLLCGLLLSGCQKAPPYVPRTVTQVTVTGIHVRRSIQRQYRDCAKIEAVLNYLRTLDFDGFTSLDPAILPGDDFTITLAFSRGENKVYRIHGARYLCRPDGSWEKVDTRKAQRLLSILNASRSD